MQMGTKKYVIITQWLTYLQRHYNVILLASFKESGNVPVSKDLLMKSANTENVKLHSFIIFVSISLPTDLLLLRSLITCFTSCTETRLKGKLTCTIKILFDCFEARMII